MTALSFPRLASFELISYRADKRRRPSEVHDIGADAPASTLRLTILRTADRLQDRGISDVLWPAARSLVLDQGVEPDD